MPVILTPTDYARWLEPGDPQTLPIDLLRPYDGEAMTAWPVSAAAIVRRHCTEGFRLCKEYEKALDALWKAEAVHVKARHNFVEHIANCTKCSRHLVVPGE